MRHVGIVTVGILLLLGVRTRVPSLTLASLWWAPT